MDIEILKKIENIAKMANSLASITMPFIEKQDDYFDQIDTEFREILYLKAHSLIDKLNIRAKG